MEAGFGTSLLHTEQNKRASGGLLRFLCLELAYCEHIFILHTL